MLTIFPENLPQVKDGRVEAAVAKIAIADFADLMHTREIQIRQQDASHATPYGAVFAILGESETEIELYNHVARAANNYLAVWLSEYHHRKEKSEALRFEMTAAVEPFLSHDAIAHKLNTAIDAVIESHDYCHYLPLTCARERAACHVAACDIINVVIPSIVAAPVRTTNRPARGRRNRDDEPVPVTQ